MEFFVLEKSYINLITSLLKYFNLQLILMK